MTLKNTKIIAAALSLGLVLTACGNNNAENTAEEPASTETTETTDTADTVSTEEATPSVGEATVPGYGGDITVKVNFGEDGVIESIDTKHEETEGIGADAIPELEKAVIDANGTEGVDNVSGATVTSEAFKSAVNEAIANAK